MEIIPQEMVKLLLSVLVGGLIGAEREFRDKVAGFRTIIFISVGSTLFTIFSLDIGKTINPIGIAANIVTGIGFLGAGAILRDGAKIAGLTTAAMIWVAAAIGMGIGSGMYSLVGIATIVIMVVMWIFPYFERWLDRVRTMRTYEITLSSDPAKREELAKAFQSFGIRVFDLRVAKSEGKAITTWRTGGPPRNHRKMVDLLLADPDVIEFRY